MKKLLGLIGSSSILASSTAVASCSYVQSEKTIMMHKIETIVSIASASLRPLLANETSGYDYNVLNSISENQRVIDIFGKEFNDKVSGTTKLSNSQKTFFDDSKPINSVEQIKEANKRALGGVDSEFKFESSTKPKGEDNKSLLSTLSLITSMIKSEGGVKPGLSNFIKQGLGTLSGFDIGDDTINTIDDVVDMLKDFKHLTPLLGELIKFISDKNMMSDIFHLIIGDGEVSTSDLLSKIFSNDGNNNIWSMLGRVIKSTNINELIKSVLKNVPDKDNFTYKQMMWSTGARINNIIASLVTDGKKIENVFPDWSKKDDANADGEIVKENVSKIFGGDINFDFSKIIGEIENIMFVVVSLITRLISVDYDSMPKEIKDADHLFSDDKSNFDFFSELGSQKVLGKEYNLEKSFKQIFSSLAIDDKDEKGVKVQRILAMLLSSGSPKKPTGNIGGLLGPKADNTDGPLSIIFRGLGSYLKKILSIDFKLNEILIRVIDNLILNDDLSVVGSLGTFIASLPNELKEVLKKVQREFVTPYNAIWNTNALGEILKVASEDLFNTINSMLNGRDLNLKTLLTTKLSSFSSSIPIEMSVSEIANTIGKELEDKRNNNSNNKVNKDVEKITNGLNTIIDSLTKEKYTIYNKNGEKKVKDASFIKALLELSKYKGYTIDKKLYGVDAAGTLLGIEKGKFVDGSLLNGFETLFSSDSIMKLLNQTIDSISSIMKENENDIKGSFTTMLDMNNFKIKNMSNGNYFDEDESKNYDEISYDLEYTNPLTNKWISVHIRLIEPEESDYGNSLRLLSIKKN